MITVIYSSNKDTQYNLNFEKHLRESIGVKEYEILGFPNFGTKSLSQVYNEGLSMSQYDIVVCVHNDVVMGKGWGKKLLKDFSNNPEFGIIGKAGTCYFSESGVYWERLNQTMVGEVYHHPSNEKKFLSKYSVNEEGLTEVISIDGVFMSFDKTKIKHTFDENLGMFHFYDHGFCVPNYLDGVKIGVTFSFDITHFSIGQPNDEFFTTKEKFVKKYSDVLPIDLKPTSVFVKPIKRLQSKDKVAIVIPTKSNVDVLIQCLDSWYQHCDSNLFHLFIGDTGSSPDELSQMKEYFETKDNITLVEYDYYNFAKINNDIVNNHISNDYRFLVFCNNDIKLLNDALSGMMKVYRSFNNVGTVGVRLHFEDNTIQHNGVLILLQKEKNTLHVTHDNLKSYHKFSKETKEVLGSTAALLMIEKVLFDSIGGYNELYTECFEDVELNLECLSFKKKNYFCGNCVAYHYESVTRNNSEEKNNRTILDFKERLVPYVVSKFDTIKDKLIYI